MAKNRNQIISNAIKWKTVKTLVGSLLVSIQVLATEPVDVMATSSTRTDGQNSAYVVKVGDTLTSISKKKNTTINQIKKANQLMSDRIYVGQVIQIPNSSVNLHEPSLMDTEMAAIQKQLHVLGYNYVPAMGGISESVAVQAIKDFQNDYGLPITGKADVETKKSIDSALLKKNIIEDTFRYLGVPYVWGGETPKGFDCSGFIYYMFNEHGVKMSRETSKTLYQKGTTVERSKLQPGDLVFFALEKPGVVSHVGFYVGNNKYISATSTKGIEVYSINHPYWAKYYYGAKRVF